MGDGRLDSSAHKREHAVLLLDSRQCKGSNAQPALSRGNEARLSHPKLVDLNTKIFMIDMEERNHNSAEPSSLGERRCGAVHDRRTR